jgi:hypothetical protein
MEDYKGMRGVMGPHVKEAIDGLIGLLRDLAKCPESMADVSVHGCYWSVLDTSGERKDPFDLFSIGEVSFVDASGRGGSSIQGCDPQNLGIIKACETYLHRFHDKPYRPEGWTSDIDTKADAEWALRKLWEPKPAEKR